MTILVKNINDVTNLVIDKIGSPYSEIAVLATLESFGVREKDVFEDYGLDTLTELSSYIYEDLKVKNPETLLNTNERKTLKKRAKTMPVSGYLWTQLKMLSIYYPIGIFLLFPILLQIATIILFGYSLWTFLGFNVIQSTAVVLGVILGFIVSGGFVQVMGKQVSFHWNHEQFTKAKQVIDALIYAGIKGLLLSFLILGGINLVFNLYPFSFIYITFVYAFLVGLLLLIVAPYHSLRQRWMISVSILLATIVALSLKTYTSLHIYYTHWIGIFTSIIISKIFLELFFKWKKVNTKNAKTKPKRIILIYRNYQYFFYGFLIYVFVFTDRFLAWSADIGYSHSFIFLYEKDYEIGMDLAIILFFLLAGVMEFSIASFSKLLDLGQKHTSIIERSKYNKRLSKMYWVNVGLLLITAVGAAAVTYLIITQPWGYVANFEENVSDISIKVCAIGSLGYFFLSWGMLNGLYLFTLNQPKTVFIALLIACVINIVSGFLFSRILGYEYSVLGMLLGSIVFMIITIKKNIQYFKKMDYYYYAAY